MSRLIIKPRSGAKKTLIDAMITMKMKKAEKVVTPAKEVKALPPKPEPEVPKFWLDIHTNEKHKSIASLEGKLGEPVPSVCTFRSTGCCGMKEFKDMSALASPAEVLSTMCQFYGGIKDFPYVGSGGESMGIAGYNVPHVVFTGITKLGEKKSNHVSRFKKGSDKKIAETVLTTDYWQKFIDYLKKYELGPVWEGPRRENSCYGNEVGVFIWNPDYTRLKQWAKDHLKAVPLANEELPNPNYWTGSNKPTKIEIVEPEEDKIFSFVE